MLLFCFNPSFMKCLFLRCSLLKRKYLLGSNITVMYVLQNPFPMHHLYFGIWEMISTVYVFLQMLKLWCIVNQPVVYLIYGEEWYELF